MKNRRDLMKLSAAFIPTVLLTHVEAGQAPKRYSMIIDIAKCYGCMACVAACASENNVPIGFFRTWVERIVKPEGNIIFIPKQCNHCENPPCVPVCPTGATYKDKNGLILIDDAKCIGCGACVEACPYGARFMNIVKGTADKCTFCDHRLQKKLLPACVEACPTGARIFGSLTEEGELRNIINTRPTQVLKSYTNANPQIYYLSLPKEADR